MRGSKARKLRRQTFGDQSRRVRTYTHDGNGTRTHQNGSPMYVYKQLKKATKS